MRLKQTKFLKQGEILAQPIYNEKGNILIQRDMHLTSTMIERLNNQGVTYVYIKDEEDSSIELESVIPNELRVHATDVIKNTFEELKGNPITKKSYLFENKESQLGTVVKDIVKEIKHKDEAVSLLTDILISDDYTFQHSLNVTIYSLAIGSKLKLSEKELADLGIGAMLHDIGKIFIEKDILLKADRLTDEEFTIMQSHTQLGFDFIRKMTDLPAVIAHCAYQHHERLDGSGYPRGLTNHDIHKYAKIIAIADVFDAVTSNRVYREAMLPHVGLEILYAGAVNIFDKDMVAAFKSSIVAYPNGLIVELNDQRKGIVVTQNKHVCDRPIIEIIQDNDGKLTTPYQVDLTKENNLTIIACHVD
ncbi:MAG TPA: HD-GYP domain-containing protein [Candidatus Dormibacteraeota bacterium]|nr:HD-GYP domain-containing protein [Candidatus Dormibacteraeota bacterium]